MNCSFKQTTTALSARSIQDPFNDANAHTHTHTHTHTAHCSAFYLYHLF